MFAPTRKVIKKLIVNQDLNGKGASKIEAEALPKNYTLSQLQEELAEDASSLSDEQKLENVLIILSSLSNPTRLLRGQGDEKHINNISIWVSKCILPDHSVISQSDIPSEDEPATIAKAISFTQSLAKHGFECLKILQTLYSISPETFDPSILLVSIVFTSRDPWTTPEISGLASSLLSAFSKQIESPAFVVDFILQTFIRPLFSKSRPSTITETGRKAIASSEPPKRFDVEAEKRDKPWKYRDVHAIAVFEWAVGISTNEIVARSWNLFIPPLLTLIEDPSTPIRSRGLITLSTFLPKFPLKLLVQTGLAPVFEDAILPTLLYLPSITPVDESLQLLPPAYRALGVLAEARFGDGETEKKEKMRFFDRVIRKGILLGYFHASEHPSIVEILMAYLSAFVSVMGIYSVKHLKDILPIISTILMDPFATPSLLYTTLAALSTIIQNAWPRISEPVHRRNILMAIVVCWRNIVNTLNDGEEASRMVKNSPSRAISDLIGVKEDLFKIGILFVKVIEKEVDMDSEFGPLIEAEPELKELFGL